ncbi:Peptide deformylase [Pelagimonas phthalicica]|uniref:Peptide deformylase n=1 Tax=Pelagimonas phthalicica TaxID=1037362 RepID=A0A238JAG1_9RHOB|nr:peptide deformylase [Pelagimonas phthalicica]TDS94616.1 peptide deformylase [Pelagimonas phthalicica]SMX26856.1 Peptide deformylase [Pelagimonas phthalicica]
MSVREVLTWPDPRLAQVCAPVEIIDPELITDMFETMYDAPGRGLAAPQIGVMQRVFVMDVGWKTGEMEPMACINPEIVSRSEARVTGEEGCLSLPGVSVEVERFAEVELRYTDLTGERLTQPLAGFASICAQHELDHLDGKMHFDRVEADLKARVLKEYEALT